MTPPSSPTQSASDEPQTPMWLPALGAAIFVAVGLAWAISPSAPAPNRGTASAPASAAPSAAADRK